MYVHVRGANREVELSSTYQTPRITFLVVLKIGISGNRVAQLDFLLKKLYFCSLMPPP